MAARCAVAVVAAAPTARAGVAAAAALYARTPASNLDQRSDGAPTLRHLLGTVKASDGSIEFGGAVTGFAQRVHPQRIGAVRARVVRQSRTVLREMGLDLPAEVEIRVWDTTADTRYMVLPVRPDHTAGWSEEQLAALVTRDGLIGVARL